MRTQQIPMTRAMNAIPADASSSDNYLSATT